MNNTEDKFVFNRSGLAALSDLGNPDYQEIYQKLEKEQHVFLEKEGDFRSADYKWPRDPLHTWSRIWEYPYVYHHLDLLQKTNRKKTPLHIVDVGSGVTFFPFSIARLGYQVTCTDIDRTAEKDILHAVEVIDYSPGEIGFRLTDGEKLPFSDSEVDAIYCVSVLEHIPTFENTIKEMARILVPEGRLILTIDICLNGNVELDVMSHKALSSCLESRFCPCYPETTVHPNDVLYSSSGPYPVGGKKDLKHLSWFYLKQGIKPFFGRKPMLKQSSQLLAVQSFVLQKLG